MSENLPHTRRTWILFKFFFLKNTSCESLLLFLLLLCDKMKRLPIKSLPIAQHWAGRGGIVAGGGTNLTVSCQLGHVAIASLLLNKVLSAWSSESSNDGESGWKDCEHVWTWCKQIANTTGDCLPTQRAKQTWIEIRLYEVFILQILKLL